MFRMSENRTPKVPIDCEKGTHLKCSVGKGGGVKSTCKKTLDENFNRRLRPSDVIEQLGGKLRGTRSGVRDGFSDGE